MKPGTATKKREAPEEFKARISKELREEAHRLKQETDERIKQIRKAASKLDGRRS